MNWEALGAVSEGLGAAAVVVTLAYLAMQVRYARAEMRRSIFFARMEAVRELCTSRANNEAWLRDFRVASDAFGGAPAPFIAEVSKRSGLPPESAARLFWDQYAWWYFRSQAIPYIDELLAGERAAFDHGILFNYRKESVGRLWYETNRAFLNPEATRYFDVILAQEP